MITRTIVYKNNLQNSPLGMTVVAQYRVGPWQLIGVIGLNCNPEELRFPLEEKRVTWWHTERYRSLPPGLRSQLNKHLVGDNWNFMKYPNPPVFYGVIIPLTSSN